KRIGLAVQREQLLAIPGATHGQIAAYFCGIEDVQRATTVESDEIGNVDQCIDRPQTNRRESSLQPIRRRTVFYSANQPQRESPQEWRCLAKFKRDLDRAGK